MVERGVILAGGNGSRLAEISRGRNKHLVEVAGRPMIDYPLDNLRDMGIEKVTVVTSPSSAFEMIDHLQPSARGELELVDIDNHCLSNDLEMTYYGGFFGDMGTPEGLKRIEEHINAN